MDCWNLEKLFLNNTDELLACLDDTLKQPKPFSEEIQLVIFSAW